MTSISYNKLSDITISMKTLDHLDMPECVYVDHKVELSRQERQLYDILKKDLIIPLTDGDIDGNNACTLSSKLMQMANGAVYNEAGKIRLIHDKKLEVLKDLIDSANGQPVLIAYWFHHDRIRIINHFTAAGYGKKIRELKSSEDIQYWNAGKIMIGLIHPKSAGHGLNLQAGGHILIWFGLTWSLELYQQTCARLWRQGQTTTVIVHNIISKETIDEDILEALKNKEITQERLILAVKARLGYAEIS